MVRIYIANLGKYNESELVGEWIDLPASEEELQELYVRIGLGYIDEDEEYHHGLEVNGRMYEEMAIHDYETDVDGLKIGEYDSIDNLNELAEELEGVNIDELNMIHENLGTNDIQECIDVWNKKDFIIMSGVKDMDDLAREYINECYGSVSEMSRETIERYFDYESYAEDVLNDYTLCDGDKAICVTR